MALVYSNKPDTSEWVRPDPHLRERKQRLLEQLRAVQAAEEAQATGVAHVPVGFGKVKEEDWRAILQDAMAADPVVPPARDRFKGVRPRGGLVEVELMDVNKLKMLVARIDQVSDLDELVLGACTAKLLKAEYEAQSIPVPEWVGEAVEALEREISHRVEDELKRQEKELASELDALKSREEKKEEKQAKLQALRARLGKKGAAAETAKG